MSDVEVILCAYKPKSNIFKSVRSVLNQSYKNITLSLVLDGNCNDEIIRQLHTIAAKDTRLSIFKFDKNLGLTHRLVTFIEQSHASYIARIDSGDIWDHTKIEKQLTMLSNNPSMVLVGTQCQYMTDETVNSKNSQFPIDHDTIVKQLIKNRGPFEHSSILFRNQLNYRPYFIYAQDHDLYLRAARMGVIGNHSEILTYCAFNFDGISFNKRIMQEKYRKISISCSIHNLDIPSKPPTQTSFSKFTWNICKPIYRKYIDNALKGRRKLAYFYLTLCCMLNYDIALLYFRKI